MIQVLVLSSDFQPVNRVDWQRAISWVCEGRVEVVDTYPDQSIGTVEGPIPMPCVVRFTGRVLKRWYRKSIRFCRRSVWARDEGLCQYCGVSVSPHSFTYDHVVPRSQGGGTNWTNIVTACRTCNHRKADRTPEQARMKLRREPAVPTILQGYEIEHHGIPEPWKAWLW